MKNGIALVCLVLSIHARAGWTDLNTGIADDLTGVVFWGNNGLVCGHNGLYYTTTGGVGPASWTHFVINGNPLDSLIYSNTKFTHAFAYPLHWDYVFACGEDTVNDVAIIMQFHIPTQVHQILFQGTSNTKLNNIRYSTLSNNYYAVGDNGLVVRFNLNVNGFTESSGLSVNYESVFFSGSRVSIGANGYKVYGTDNNPGLNLNTSPLPGKHLKDIWMYDIYQGIAVGDAVYGINYFTGLITPYTNYDFGPLNANCVYRVGSYVFIGTDHGIFRVASSNAIEWQPSSLEHEIHEFWNLSVSYPFYACGRNGVLLSTTDNGGTPLPYVNVAANGICKGQILPITFTYGSAATCQLFINGTQVSSSCSGYSFIGNATGMYEVKLKGTNVTGTDSAMSVFYVVDTPEVNLPYVLNDDILCKKEPVIIEIDQTQDNVYYQLTKAIEGTSYGNSPEGNGGIISYTTDSLSQSGGYFLKATSTLAACSLKFTDTIDISVEHTKANYHLSKANLVPGEEMKFFETCTEANNYSWEFPVGSIYVTSNLANPMNSFSVVGNQQIKLLTWSDNFCYDSIIGPGPTVYDPPATYDSCWVNMNNGDDPEWMGSWYNEISDLTPLSDGGYLISGTFHDHSFATTYGDSLKLGWYGSYLAKYDKDGVYKWNVHSLGAGSIYFGGTDNHKYTIFSTAVDADGNIYGCGYFKDYYIDNSGDTTLSTGTYFDMGHIFKLDSLGKTIWQRNTGELHPTAIEVDHDGNILVTSVRNDFYNDGIELHLNEALTNILPSLSSNFGITKFSSNGDLLWDVPIQMNFVNGSGLLGVTFDNLNNIYLAGHYEQSAVINSVGVTATVDCMSIGLYNQKMLLAKFNPGGTLEWLTRSFTSPGGNCIPLDIETDDNGNSYIVGHNDAHLPGHMHFFENTDNTLDSTSCGKFFLMKTNASGICQWIHGPSTMHYGYAHEVELVDDTIYVLATMNAMALPLSSLSFNNLDSSSVNFDIAKSDYFVAIYDTSGYIHRTFKNGENNMEFNTDFMNGFHKGTDGNFYAARNDIGMSESPFLYVDFGDTILNVNGIEGWVTKFCEDCGITYEAGFEKVTDTILCIGSSYTFPDGTALTNIITETHDTVTLNSINAMDSVIITNIYVNGSQNLVDSLTVCYNQNYTFPDGTILSNITTVSAHTSVLQTILGCDSIVTTIITPLPLLINPVDSVSVCYNNSYTFMDGFILNNITAQTAHDNYLTSINGCDSVIQTVVYPTEVINTTLTVSGFSITSNHIQSMGTTYQWVDCANGYAPIIGQQGQTFTPDTDGSYAVMINENGCVDTSVCVSVYGTGLNEQGVQVAIYPNPTQDAVWISLDQTGHYLAVRMLDATGREILTEPLFDRIHKLSLPATKGIYYIQLVDENGNYTTHAVTKL